MTSMVKVAACLTSSIRDPQRRSQISQMFPSACLPHMKARFKSKGVVIKLTGTAPLSEERAVVTENVLLQAGRTEMNSSVCGAHNS
jgi:hypothetical protein